MANIWELFAPVGRGSKSGLLFKDKYFIRIIVRTSLQIFGIVFLPFWNSYATFPSVISSFCPSGLQDYSPPQSSLQHFLQTFKDPRPVPFRDVLVRYQSQPLIPHTVAYFQFVRPPVFLLSPDYQIHLNRIVRLG